MMTEEKEAAKECLPTSALPGSMEKIAVMRARAARGQALFHPADAGGDSEYFGVLTPTLANGAIVTGATVRTRSMEAQMKEPDPPQGSIGLRLRWFRTNGPIKLSQQQLADRVGLSKRQLGRIERDGAEPTLATAISLCKALGISLETLIGGD